MYCIKFIEKYFAFLTDPLFPLTFLIESWIPAFVDALCQASFLCSLLLFWLCVYHGLRQVSRIINMNY